MKRGKNSHKSKDRNRGLIPLSFSSDSSITRLGSKRDLFMQFIYDEVKARKVGDRAFPRLLAYGHKTFWIFRLQVWDLLFQPYLPATQFLPQSNHSLLLKVLPAT